jgi:hypothetical protein
MQSTKLKSRSGQVPQHWRGILPIHPAAELLPRMSDAELLTLGEDIKRNDLHTPVVLFTDQHGTEFLLDGRNRLDAMEREGLPIIEDGELNPAIVHKISGNIDPFAWVLSANLHRRHLTSEQKREVIEKCLKDNPNKSNRQIAKEANDDHKKVGRMRKKLESTGAVPRLEKTTGADGKDRKRPVRQSKPKPAVTPEPDLAESAEAPEVEKEENLTQEEDSLATRIIERNLGSALPALSDESIWPTLNASRKKRLQKALKQLKGVCRELIELAKPAPRRGRPPKASAS